MSTDLVPQTAPATPAPPVLLSDLATDDQVGQFLTRLFAQTRPDPGADDDRQAAPATIAAAILPWVCDRLSSKHSHSDIRTTQLYYQPSAKDSEETARHIQIR